MADAIDWYAEVTKPAAAPAAQPAVAAAAAKTDWYAEVAGAKPRAPGSAPMRGQSLPWNPTPEPAPEPEPGAIYHPDRAASMGHVAIASLAEDPMVRARYYAKARGMDPAKYQIVNGSPAYPGDDGKMYFEEPSGHYFPRSLTEAGGMVADKVGPAIPFVAGGATGLLTAPLMLAGPGGVATSVAATGGAAATAEAARQTFAKLMLGQDYHPGSIAMEGLTAGVGQGVGAGLTKLAQRHVAQDIGRLNAQDTTKLRDLAKREGIDLTPAEETNLASLRAQQKYLTNGTRSQDTMQDFYEKRAGQVDTAINRFLESVSPVDSGEVAGAMTRRAASTALDRAPESIFLRSVEEGLGNRMTAEQSGEVIRRELAQTAERRSGMRSALATGDYDAARASGEVINTDPVLSLINDKLATLKGGTRDAVESARQHLMVGRAPDRSVGGLVEADKEIADLIKAARREGKTNQVFHLEEIQESLRGQLDAAPQAGQARRNFAAASEPLAPFQEGVVGRSIEPGEFGRGYDLPVEQIAPKIFRGGATEVDNFLRATENQPAARHAFENYLTTEARDAGRSGPDALRRFVTDNEEVLGRFPALRERLNLLGGAHDARAALGDTMTGRLASMGDPQLGKAAQTLFGASSGPRAIAEAKTQLEAASPEAWQALKRTWIQDVFERSAQEYASNYGNVPNVAGKFTAALRGNPQTMARLKAALSPEEFTALSDLTDVLKAASRVKPIGSDTEFNRLITEAERAKARPFLAKVVGNLNPAQAMRSFDDWLTNRAMGNNAERLAQIITQPGAAETLKSLRIMSPKSAAYRVAVGRLLTSGAETGASAIVD